MASGLENEFHREMERVFDVAVSLDYRPTYFLQMVQEHGGMAAAKRLLSSREAQLGLIRLWELERLDISMEALVLQERWNPLFSDAERQTARERLQAYGYDPPADH